MGKTTAARIRLDTGRHAIYRLAPDLSLIFKPRGHYEEEHAHPYRQQIRVVRGELRIDTGERSLRLRPDSAALALEAGERHSTTALEGTWLIVEAFD
jgi:quercetin dioxygenase-like cupin family protein